MRTLCDVCESAAAILFCAADEAALCQSCDDQVHLCNKLASRHVRVKLADPSGVGSCDICENAPGKRTHGRYLLFRQRVEFPRDKPGHLEELTLQHVDPGEVRTGKTQTTNVAPGDRVQNHGVSFIPTPDHNNHEHGKMETKMIDLNARPNRINGQVSNSQVQSLDTCNGYCS